MRSSSDITATGNINWKTPHRASDGPLISRISGPELSQAMPACQPSGSATNRSPFFFGQGPSQGIPTYPNFQPSRSEPTMIFDSLYVPAQRILSHLTSKLPGRQRSPRSGNLLLTVRAERPVKHAYFPPDCPAREGHQQRTQQPPLQKNATQYFLATFVSGKR